MVVCTRDRLDVLPECLASLERQAADPSLFEIVVVDNGSTDGTVEWLRGWAREDPARRRVAREPRAGLSRARNAGAELASGEVVLFVDDDAVAHDGWLEAHLRRYAADPEIGAVGGRIELSWPPERPSWLGAELEHWFSALDLGPEPVSFSPPRHPYGANMSVRRSDLLEAGGFAVELGRKGGSLVSGEEHELFTRLWARGRRIEYEPAAVVTHRVLPHRLRRRWVLRRGWAQGRGNARMQRREGRATSLRRTCWTETRAAVADLGALATLARERSSGAVLDDVARRSGHLAAAIEHLWTSVRDTATRTGRS